MRPVPEHQAAKAAGERFYMPTKPCKSGHTSKRSTTTGACCACASRNSLKMLAKRPEHPARVEARAIGAKRYNTSKPCQNGHAADRFTCNGICVECDAGKKARWRKRRPGLEAKWARERRAKDPTRHRAEVKRWKKKNPIKARLIGKVGDAKRRSAETAAGGTFTPADVRRIRAAQKGKCAAPNCRKRLREFHVDHILAIKHGGSSNPSNLQLLCPTCNRIKSAKDPLTWARSCGVFI